MRIAWRLPAIVAGTGMLVLLWLAALPFIASAPSRRRAWRGLLFRNWARGCLRCVGARVRVSGSPPASPCFLVTNHFGYIDIAVIASRVNCVFLSDTNVRDVPLLGRMARSFGTVYIERKKKRDLPAVTRALRDALDSGEIVVLFPEGTNSCGDRVHRFHPALIQAAVERGDPVAWATLRYATGPSDPPASRSVPWLETPIVEHVLGFLALERIDATLIFGSGTVRGTDRKALAHELERRVAAQFEPMA